MSDLCLVTTGSGTIPQTEEADSFAESWQELRSNGDIQFEPVELPEIEPPETPDWLERFIEWLSDVLGPVGEFIVGIWPVLQWVLLAALVAIVLIVIIRMAQGREWRSGRKTAQSNEWVPEKQAALALLEEADRLANEGRYDEATHLLLKRSVGQIAEARPDLVEPSSTARELASEPAIPEAARRAFGAIAERVERSLFALRKLTSDDWQVARDAYAEFALEQKSLTA